MDIAYDFDIQWMIDEAAPHRPATYHAMFRDVRLLDVIDRAGPKLQALLSEAGFGFECYSSGAPAGFYPKADEACRSEVVSRLRGALAEHALTRDDLGSFDMKALLAVLTDAQPLTAKQLTKAIRKGPEASRSDKRTPLVLEVLVVVILGIAGYTVFFG